MKIVMFTDAYWPRVNGVTVSVDSYARSLIRRGHQVMIICPFYPETQAVERMFSPVMDKKESSADPTVIRVPSYPLPISKEDRVAKFHKWFWVSKQLNAFEPDVIHIHSEFVIGEFGFYYAKLRNLKVVYTFHTFWEEYAANYIPFAPDFLLRFIARRIVKNMAKRADSIIAPSSQIKDVLTRYKIKKRVALLPTGIDQNLFTHTREETVEFRLRFEDKFPIITGKRLLLFAGRIGNEKNISFLLRLLPRIFSGHDDVVFVAAGNGPDLPYFIEEAEEIGIGRKCLFTGYLDRKDLSLLYTLASVFVFPSCSETQGLVTIEAMLSGIPVVAIGEMGTVHVMGGDNGGFMVKHDENEFAGRVIQLLDDTDLHAKKAAEAKAHAQDWTIDTMTVRLESIYEETIGS